MNDDGAFDYDKYMGKKTGPSPFDEILTREEKAREKAKNRAVENKEFEDKRQPKSDLIRQAEIARMKEILDKSKGGGGGGGIPKLNRDLTKNMKKGGKVSSASKRADGCAIRGKTRA
jgi:hypothetical protein